MTVRRLHFKTTLPAEPSQNRKKDRRAARALMTALALAGLAWAFSGFSVSPSELDFGGERVGQNDVVEAVEIINRSSAAVAPNVRVEGEFASDFQYESSACAQIAAGERCRLPVQFAPQEPGKKLATMVIHLGSQEPRTVALRGIAFPAGVTVAPLEVNFPDVTVGGSSDAEVTVSGETWFHIHGVSLQDLNQAQFKAYPGTCREPSAKRKQCVIRVEFRPSSPGNFTATLRINDDGVGAPHAVTLRGKAIPPEIPPEPPKLPPPAPKAVIDPLSLDFSQNHGAAQQVHVRNQGNAPLAVSQIEMAGDDADRFRADKQSCPEITPGSECVISVGYRGKWFGRRKTAYTAELRVHDNDANQSAVQTVALRLTENAANANARLSLEPASLSFSGTAPPGKPTTLTAGPITVRNDGPGDIKTFLVYLEPFNKENKFFSYKSGCTKLSEGGTCDIYVTFTGTEPRGYKDTLYISGQGAKQVSVSLDATLAPASEIIQ